MQDRQTPLDPFVGRTAELARVAEAITRVKDGQPWLVAIEGDPGIGKTALARRGLAGVASLRVLSARADQAEADLDFGIVDQLLRGAGGSAPAAALTGASSSFSVGARLLEVVGEQQAAALAIVIDDLQWADRKSVEALMFMLRRLSVDPVITVVTYRGPSNRLDEAAQRLLLSVENRLFIPLAGLDPAEVTSLAAALRAEALDEEAAGWLYRQTGGHPLYLRTLLSEGSGFDPDAPGRLAVPRSLAAAVGDHLRVLPAESRVILEMLAVLNLRMPLAQLGPGRGDQLAHRGDRAGRGGRPGGVVAGRTHLPGGDPPPAGPGRDLRRHPGQQAPAAARPGRRPGQRGRVVGAPGGRPGPAR